MMSEVGALEPSPAISPAADDAEPDTARDGGCWISDGGFWISSGNAPTQRSWARPRRVLFRSPSLLRGHRDTFEASKRTSGAVDRRLRGQAIAAFMLGEANETLDGCFTDHDSEMQLTAAASHLMSHGRTN